MKRDDIQGAIAAARYYTQLFVHMNATNETEAIEKMSLPDCRGCSHWVKKAKERERDGRVRISPEADIVKIEHSDTWSDGHKIFVVKMRVIFAPWTEHDSDGTIVTKVETPSPGDLTYNLIRDNDAWRVYEVIPESDAATKAEAPNG